MQPSRTALLGGAVLAMLLSALLVSRVDGQDTNDVIELDGPNVCKKVEE